MVDWVAVVDASERGRLAGMVGELKEREISGDDYWGV